MASCAGVQPISFDSRTTSVAILLEASFWTTSASHSTPGTLARLDAGMPSRYLPVKTQKESGLHVVSPMPSSLHTGARNLSTRSRCSCV